MERQVWHTMVIRLWRDGDGLKVRFLAGRTGQSPSALTLETSVESATRQFERWLRSTGPEDAAVDDGPSPAQATNDGTRSPRETERRRWGDGHEDSALLPSPGVEDDAMRDDVRREPS
jgi:hypothetical protein